MILPFKLAVWLWGQPSQLVGYYTEAKRDLCKSAIRFQGCNFSATNRWNSHQIQKQQYLQFLHKPTGRHRLRCENAESLLVVSSPFNTLNVHSFVMLFERAPFPQARLASASSPAPALRFNVSLTDSFRSDSLLMNNHLRGCAGALCRLPRVGGEHGWCAFKWHGGGSLTHLNMVWNML